MNEYLSLGIVQMPTTEDSWKNIKYFKEKAVSLASSYKKPHIIVGVEEGIGIHPLKIDSAEIHYLKELAKALSVWLLPGTMTEECDGKLYTTLPIISPAGEISQLYRKIAPSYPEEEGVSPGDNFITFEVEGIIIGVQICYDMAFPGISRGLMLKGAEVIIQLTADPTEVQSNYKYVPIVRGLENQLYFVWINSVGDGTGSYKYGESKVISPDGEVLWQGDNNPLTANITIDLRNLRENRKRGLKFYDETLLLLKHLDLISRVEDLKEKSSFYKSLPVPTLTESKMRSKLEGIGVSNKGDINWEKLKKIDMKYKLL